MRWCTDQISAAVAKSAWDLLSVLFVQQPYECASYPVQRSSNADEQGQCACKFQCDMYKIINKMGRNPWMLGKYGLSKGSPSVASVGKKLQRLA